MADTLQEFLVSLKYAVDTTSQRSFLDALKRAATSMSGVAGEAVGLAGAITAMAHSMAEAAEKLYFMSLRLGMSVADIKAATYAMSQFGISAAEAHASMEAFGNWQRSYGPAATAMLRNFGITATDTAGRLSQLGEFFRAHGGTLEGAQTNSLQYAWIKQFAESLGISEKVMQEMASSENAQRQREYNNLLRVAGVNTEEYSKQGHDLISMFRQLGAVFEVLWIKLAQSMFPDLTNDLSRLYKMLVHHLPTLTQLVVQVGNVFVFLANSITNVIGLLVDFGDNVAALIHALPAGFREIAEAMAVFSLSLIRSPVFWFIAGLTVLLGLLDDYMVWQKNPKGAAFDWSWTKGLDHFMKCILGIKGGFSQLFLLLGGLLFFIRPLMGLAGAVLNIGTKAQVAAGMVGGLRSALALLAAVWGSRWLRDKLQEGSDWLTDKMFGKGHAAEIEKMHQQGGAQFPDWFHHMMDWLGGRSPEATAPTAGGGGAAAEPMQPSDPTAKRNMRNFNPGNLEFAGQEGAVLEGGANPRFARFPNMIAGVAATVRQLRMNQQRGIDTLRGQITRWAPAYENDTTGYIRNVARMTGLDPDARLDTNDPAVLAKLVQAITTVEGGKGLDADTVSLGVQRALGSRPILPPGLDNTRTQTADAGGRGGVVINQQTSVHVAPGPTAGSTAREVADQQGRVNENLVRNTAGILR